MRELSEEVKRKIWEPVSKLTGNYIKETRMNKKKFEQRFGEDREKYLQAQRIERTIKAYLDKYGYDLLHWVMFRIMDAHRQQRNLRKEIQQKEAELQSLKSKKT